jgi:hypothetical protein
MRLCLAGLNSIRSGTYEILPEIPFILESFYYVRDYQIPLIHSAELFLLDSGAFTFMSNSKKAVDWDEYLDRYIAFINEHKVKYFFELDIDAVVGYDEMKRMRARLERETGRRCIPVWHKSRGIDEFKKLCADYDYIAIGGIVTKEITREEYPQMKKLVAYARQNGTKVHGLGFTEKDIADYGFYSCDSTTWNMVSRFGKIYRFTDGRIVVATPKGKKIDKSKYVEGEVHNIREWIKYQNYLRQF